MLLTQDFLDCMLGTCASFDWLICGDARGLAFGLRKNEQQRRVSLEALRNLDEVELAMLVKANKSNRVEHVPFEEALEGWKREVETHWAGLALRKGRGVVPKQRFRVGGQLGGAA